MNLIQLFTAIANAIRAKTGSSETITPTDFANQIDGIPTGIDTSDATATAGDIILNKTAYVNGQKITGTIPTETELRVASRGAAYQSNMKILNVTYTFTDETRKYYTNFIQLRAPASQVVNALNLTADKIKKDVTILGITGTYAGETPNLQSKSVTITENGTQTITPDSGYDGLDEVEVTTNVQATSEYNAKLDYSGITNSNYKYAVVEINDLDLSDSTSCNSAFSGFGKLKSIGKITTTSKVTNMVQMFGSCAALTALDTSNFNTSNVTSMNNMFYFCTALTSLDLSTFNTAKVSNMNGMFYGCSGLTNLDLSSFDTSKVTNMGQMFRDCSNLTTINFGENFTAKGTTATGMNAMFTSCTNLSNTTLNDILSICTTFGGSSNKTLKYIGLNSTQATTCQTLSNWSAAEAAGWTTGY